tara:strand:+ start:219 stop:611 length:393 start_codon:yes stop_codon:yes gene_type:complete
MSKPSLGDWLNSINQFKKNLMDEDPSVEKSYPQVIINKALSAHTDAVLFANEMNKNWELPKKMQYDFYINSLRPRRRFSPWTKKKSLEYLDVVKEYYNCSYTKALEIIRILSIEQLEEIKGLLFKGGATR